MEQFFVFIVIWIVIAGIRMLLSDSGGYGRTPNFDAPLRVRMIDDTFTPDEGPTLPVKRVSISGAIHVPRANQPVRFKLFLADVTGSGEDMPIFCHINELCDENGLFEINEDTNIPYEFSEVSDMEIAAIPVFALVGPHRGPRRVRAQVLVCDQYNEERVYSHGNTVFSFEQTEVGYVEIGELTRAREKQIGQLALAVSASDGHIDKRESRVIKQYFEERFAGQEDVEDRRRELTETLQETLGKLKSESESSGGIIERVCRQLRDDGDDGVMQAAYELCVRVVAADDVVQESEQSALRVIADRLGLPAEFVKEVHDRNLRLSMYDDADDEQLVGMPAGLSHDEKLNWIREEYSKWRKRVTHKDPEVAAEAELRIQRLTKLRTKLTDGE